MKGVTKRCLFLCGVIALLSQWGSSLAQEAALYGYTSAVRFEESPGYFHYILECRDVNGSTSTSTNVPGTELALCWSVVAAHFQVMDGKIDEKTSNPTSVKGVLKISKSHVSFVPEEPSPANPERTFATSDVALQHQAGQVSGFVAVLAAGKGEFYKFVFVSVCSQCAATPPLPDPAKAGQMDAEFVMISETIKDFDGSLKRYRELSSHMRLTVSPENQPGPSATTDSLKRFSELNRDMAEMCSEPAKSCIQTYSRYQACSTSGAPTSCGATPTCSASCTLVPRDYFFKLHAEVRFTPPVPPEVSATAWLSPTTPGSPGVVGMSGGIFGGLGPTPSVAARPANAAGPMRIASGVVAGLKLTGDAPVYPPIARAAHMQGTVTLHAIISKEGKMERVEVISGPALLQGAALEAVKQWTYKPYLLNGMPTEVDTTVIVNFNLNPNAGSAPAAAPATN